VAPGLVVNAAEAMEGAGTISIAARRGAPGCVVEVADDGRGIHPDDMASIFRESYTTKTVHGNKGLGLHTVRALIEHAGGSISCSSRPGHGTRFTVTLSAE
jgi:signal transduction histidine kinase